MIDILFKLFLGIILIDHLIIQRYLIIKARYFALHFLFNIWIIKCVYPGAIFIFNNPLMNYINDVNFIKSGQLSTGGIIIFHFYHTCMNYSNLVLEDWVHHVVSCFIVGYIGISCPIGIVLNWVNLIMCGIPGGIDYLLLVLMKYEIIFKQTEKRINRLLNLLIRMQGYIWYLNIWKIYSFGMSKFVLITLGVFLQLLNSIYYCDKVVGNYYTTITDLKKNE